MERQLLRHSGQTASSCPSRTSSAKAITYLLLGGLALAQALWSRGTRASPSQGMHLLRQEPLGTAALGLLAAGMICYGAHRCLESVVGPVRTKSQQLEALHRVARVTGGLSYFGFAVLALMFMSSRQRSGDSQSPLFANRLMHHPLGNTLLAIVGGVLVGIGVAYLYDLVSGRFRESYELSGDGIAARVAVAMVAIYGIGARAIFFCSAARS